MVKKLRQDIDLFEQKTQILPNGYRVSYRNDCELEVIYDDIFTKNVYFFEASNAEPYIVDCGGHIGLAVLYFKSLYPRSRIVTFEPNPATFALLQKNIAQNDLRGVEAINMALTREGNKDAILYVGENFLQAWDSTDTIEPELWANMDQYRGISVRSTRLSSYINGKVDFVKIDIEGAEGAVLDELNGKLHSIGAITLEYHQNPGNLVERRLERIITTLHKASFKSELFYQGEPIRFDRLPKDPVYQLIIRATK
jgi:FkbM family methyltransferase